MLSNQGSGRRFLMKLTRHRVRTIRDGRGMLRVFEKGASLPFPLKRCFVISGVPKGKARGEHAVSCDLFLTALAGTCRLAVRNSGRPKIIPLTPQAKGAAVPKGAWLRLDRFSSDAIILVCASQIFRRTRYSAGRYGIDV
jgi:WxcM-like, C-terminal